MGGESHNSMKTELGDCVQDLCNSVFSQSFTTTHDAVDSNGAESSSKSQAEKFVAENRDSGSKCNTQNQTTQNSFYDFPVGLTIGNDSIVRNADGSLADEDVAMIVLHQITNNRAALAVLENANSVVQGHFVYKSGLHGPLYIDKLKFNELEIQLLDYILRTVVCNAVIIGGLRFEPCKVVRVIGPAYGASGYPHTIALELSKFFPENKFKIGSTQLYKDENGIDRHFLPEKYIEKYVDTDIFIMSEDIINSATTIKEVSALFYGYFGKGMTYALSIANRGGKIASDVGLDGLFALLDRKFDQWDPRIPRELDLINALGGINQVLGKGKGWVSMFGDGPYPAGTDFSAYPFE